MKLTQLIAAVAVCLLAHTANAQLFSEGFDSAAADVKINAQADTAFSFVDYSAIAPIPSPGNLGLTGIPEAPRMVAGSLPTRGLKLEGNLAAGAAAGVNVLAGANPIAFSGNYRLSFDAFQLINNNPFPSGSTEQLLWGVGTDDTDPIEARNTRNSGAIGTWGWLDNENGYGTEDAAIFENGVELADLGDTQLFEDVFFNTAFPCRADGLPTDSSADPPNGAAGNDWVQVDIDVISNGDGTSTVSVYYNFVEFFSESVADASVNGFAMLGYEDPFSSVNSDPMRTFGLFDNFVVTADPVGAPMGTLPTPIGCVPEPTTGLLCVFGLLAALAARKS